MAISLTKGTGVSLSKHHPELRKMQVGLGWDARQNGDTPFDLDASVFLLTGENRVPNNQNFIFYNHLKSPCGSVEHTGDNRTGVGDGDDEVVHVDLSRIPASVEKIAITVTIHDAVARRQHFGLVEAAFIRIVNIETGAELVRFALTEDYSGYTAVIFGELVRQQGEWHFNAVGEGVNGGLETLCSRFGVQFS